MLSKETRLLKSNAKKQAIGIKRVFKLMDDSLSSNIEYQVCVASAFYQIISFHIENGDLRPDDVNLATLLRSNF